MRQVCRECTWWCKQLALCAGELVAIDGSTCQAVNATERNCTSDQLKTLLQQIAQRVEGDLKALEGQDHADEAGTPGGAVADNGQAKMAALPQRKRLYVGLQVP